MSVKYEGVPIGDPLDLLVEECSEIIKEVMKARRFGLDGTKAWMDRTGEPSPRERIISEIGDFYAAVAILANEGSLGDISGPELMLKIEAAMIAKLEKVEAQFGYKLSRKAFT